MVFPLRLVKMLFRYLSSLTFLLVPFLLLGEEREAWTSSKISGSPDLPPPYVAEAVWPHITFNRARVEQSQVLKVNHSFEMDVTID